MHNQLLKLLVLVSLTYFVVSQQVGTTTPEVHPTLTTQECTKSRCQTRQTKVVLDANWRWLHSVGGFENCYPSSWNPTLCPDPATCARQCALEGVDYRGSAGITTTGDSLHLNYVTKTQYGDTIGSRVFLVDTDDTNYKMFNLLNKEFTFDVDVSKLPCGTNGALYLVEMDKDGGLSQTNKAGSKYGTGYCDAQCPHDVKHVNGLPNVRGAAVCCNEMDIWEANSMSAALSPHPCDTVGPQWCNSPADCGDGNFRARSICDKDGCDFNSYRMGDKNFYGKNLPVDTKKPFTVVTQFLTTDGTDNGDLSEIRRYYIQGGKVIPNSKAALPGIPAYDSISDKMCEDVKRVFNDDANTFKLRGGMKAMGDAIKRGMVLVLSIWDDASTNMNWLDSVQPNGNVADPAVPGIARGACPRAAGNPTTLRSGSADSYVVYSKIKYGEIGTTTQFVLPGKVNPTDAPRAPPARQNNPPAGNDAPRVPPPRQNNPPADIDVPRVPPPRQNNPPADNDAPRTPPSNDTPRVPPRQSVNTPAVSLNANTNPFVGRSFYVNPAYQHDLETSIKTTTDSATKQNLEKMRDLSSAFWVDTISKIDAPGSTNTLRYNLNRAAAMNPSPLLVVIVYDLPNRDCAAKASNGEICCYTLPNGRCDYTRAGDCSEGINKYKTEYIDALHALIAAHPSVPIALIIEPDSLPNFVTNLGVPACGNSATQAAYRQGIKYAVDKLSELKNAVIYIDAAHGGWLGWDDGATGYAAAIASLGILPKIRGFATNVANYQATGSRVCPTSDHCVGGKNTNDPCCEDPCGLATQYNRGHNELNYANFLRSKFSAHGKSDVHFIIDTGRNGNSNVRSSCSNWCNIRNAAVGQAPTTQTADSQLVDAYFWLKTPGESDGCTSELPDGKMCPRFDSMCGSPDSLGSRNGEPRAPEAGTWFDYQIKQLAKNARLGTIPANPRPTPRPQQPEEDVRPNSRPNSPPPAQDVRPNLPAQNPRPVPRPNPQPEENVRPNPPAQNPRPTPRPQQPEEDVRQNSRPNSPPPTQDVRPNPPPQNPRPQPDEDRPRPPPASQGCAGVSSGGQDSNEWYVELIAPEGSTVQLTCGNGERISLEFRNWGRYTWVTDGRTTCPQPRTATVNGRSCTLRAAATADDGEVFNEVTEETHETGFESDFDGANAVGEVYDESFGEYATDTFDVSNAVGEVYANEENFDGANAVAEVYENEASRNDDANFEGFYDAATDANGATLKTTETSGVTPSWAIALFIFGGILVVALVAVLVVLARYSRN